jgi:hypothetical protein
VVDPGPEGRRQRRRWTVGAGTRGAGTRAECATRCGRAATTAAAAARRRRTQDTGATLLLTRRRGSSRSRSCHVDPIMKFQQQQQQEYAKMNIVLSIAFNRMCIVTSRNY